MRDIISMQFNGCYCFEKNPIKERVLLCVCVCVFVLFLSATFQTNLCYKSYNMCNAILVLR